MATDGRLSQFPVEVGLDTNPSGRLSQVPVEVAISVDAAAQLSQAVIEVAVGAAGPELLSQLVVEVAVGSPPGQTLLGALDLTGQTPVALVDQFWPVPAGALLLEGVPPELNTVQLEMPVGALSLLGQAPIASLTGQKTPGVGALHLAGLAPTSVWVTGGFVSQLVVETLTASHATANVSQVLVEVILRNPALTRTSQLLIEIIRYALPPETCITVHHTGCPIEFAPPPASGGPGCAANFGPGPTVSDA